MTDRKNLSVCIVTYNDEAHITDCLNALEGCADEMIVADIGSKDQTVMRARNAGAKVFNFEWAESFSDARNFCMAQASGRWVLFLRACETIAAADSKKLPLLLANPNAEGYLLKFAGAAGLKRVSPNSRLRLIRNRKEYCFQYRAFEQLPDEQIANIENAPVKVRQYGDGEPWDIAMRLHLLKQDVAENPQAHYIRYAQGLCFLNAGMYEESTSCFECGCEGLNPDRLFSAHAYQCWGWSLLHQKRYPEALAVLEKAVEAFALHTDLLVLRAEAHWQLGSYCAAIRDLKRCLNTMQQPERVVPAPEISAAVVWESLGAMMMHLANTQQGLACFQQAYCLNSRNTALFANLCALAVEADMPQALLGILGLALKQNIPAQLLAAAQAFLALGQYEKALALTSRLSQTDLADRTLAVEFLARQKVGKAPRALAELEAERLTALPGRIRCCLLYENLPEAQALFVELDQAGGIAPPVKAAYRLMQAIFCQGTCPDSALAPEAYHEIAEMHDLLLISGQTEKAGMLLPQLLTEDVPVTSVMLWARCNDFDALRRILEAAMPDEVQALLKQRVLKKLLQDGHLETAQKLLDPSAAPTEEMTLALWSARSRDKLAELGRLSHRVNEERLETEESAESLAQFLEAVQVRAGVESEKSVSTCGEMHAKIGVAFERLHKTREAMAAYLRALQRGPNALAEERLSVFWQSRDTFEMLLEKLPWVAQSSLFHARENFADYVRGLCCFGNGQLEQAYAWFDKAAAAQPDSPATACKLVICWLEEKKSEADALIKDIEPRSPVWAWCFTLLKGEILRRLGQGLSKNPDNGLLMAERESVLALNLPMAAL